MKRVTHIGLTLGTATLLALVLCLGFLSSCGPKPGFFALYGDPDFCTSQGTAVFTNDIRGITEHKVDSVLEFFAIEFPKLIDEVSENEVRDILKQTILTWEPEIFDCWVGKCNGTQQGYYLRVHWTGSIQSCCLFHELTHEIMQFTHDFIDYNHTWEDWWDAVETLKRDFGELGVD